MARVEPPPAVDRRGINKQITIRKTNPSHNPRTGLCDGGLAQISHEGWNGIRPAIRTAATRLWRRADLQARRPASRARQNARTPSDRVDMCCVRTKQTRHDWCTCEPIPGTKE